MKITKATRIALERIRNAQPEDLENLHWLAGKRPDGIIECSTELFAHLVAAAHKGLREKT